MRPIPALTILALLAACAQPQVGWVLYPSNGKTCGAETLQGLIGQPVSKLPASGSWTRLRILHPGEAATMDFSETRLTVMVDAANRIDQLLCQ